MTTRLNPDAKEFVPTFPRSQQYSPETDVLFMSTAFNGSESSVESQRDLAEVSQVFENVYVAENLSHVAGDAEEEEEEHMTNLCSFRTLTSSKMSDQMLYEGCPGSNSLAKAHMGDGDHGTKFLERSELTNKDYHMQRVDIGKTESSLETTDYPVEKRAEKDKKVTITTSKLPTKSSPDGAQSHRCALNTIKTGVSKSNLPSSQRPRTAPMSGRTCDQTPESNPKATPAATNLKNVPGTIKEVKVAPLQFNKSRGASSISSSKAHVESKRRPATSSSLTSSEALTTTDFIAAPKTSQNSARKPVLPRATVAFTLRRNEAMKKKNLIPGNTGKI